MKCKEVSRPHHFSHSKLLITMFGLVLILSRMKIFGLYHSGHQRQLPMNIILKALLSPCKPVMVKCINKAVLLGTIASNMALRDFDVKAHGGNYNGKYTNSHGPGDR